jgi:Flp pilus assembly protein TadD
LLARHQHRDSDLKNALEVCLLRLGDFDAALTLYRQLLGVGEQFTITGRLKNWANFATGLLVSGNIEAGLNVLAQYERDGGEIPEPLRARLRD